MDLGSVVTVGGLQELWTNKAGERCYMGSGASSTPKGQTAQGHLDSLAAPRVIGRTSIPMLKTNGSDNSPSHLSLQEPVYQAQ